MARGPRLDHPGTLLHVIARGIERREIFYSDGDRHDFLDPEAAPAVTAPRHASFTTRIVTIVRMSRFAVGRSRRFL